MTSIFSSQNLQTFRRRKYCFLPPGAPAPPSRLPERSLDPDSLRAAAIVVRSLLTYEGAYPSAPPRYGDYTSIALGHAALKTDRKSTRLNSSHVSISYAVFC